MAEMVKILMDREGLTKAEAKERVKEIRNTIWEILDAGGGYDEVEEYLLDEGFEMDYIMELVA